MVEEFVDVETDVDTLVSLVKQKGSISIENAASQLKVPVETLQRWVDFLVEEEVLGIEYKFITPYLYFNKPLKKQEVGVSVEEKKEFFEKAKKRGLAENRIFDLWQRYLNQNLTEFRKNFITKAEKKGLSGSRAQELWQEYYDYLKSKDV